MKILEKTLWLGALLMVNSEQGVSGSFKQNPSKSVFKSFRLNPRQQSTWAANSSNKRPVSLPTISPTSSPSTSGSSSSIQRKKWSDHIALGVVASFTSPALSSIVDTETLMSQNSITGGYRFDNGWSLGGAFNFSYSPATKSTDILDPFLMVQNFRIINLKNYNFGGYLRSYLPVSEPAHRAKLLNRTRLAIAQTYQFTNSRWSTSLFTFVQGYLYEDGRRIGATRVLLFAEPSLNFQINPNLSVNLAYDLDIRNDYEQPLTALDHASTILVPSLSWSATNWLSIEPSVGVTTGDRVDWSTTSANLTLSARLP